MNQISHTREKTVPLTLTLTNTTHRTNLPQFPLVKLVDPVTVFHQFQDDYHKK